MTCSRRPRLRLKLTKRQQNSIEGEQWQAFGDSEAGVLAAVSLLALTTANSADAITTQVNGTFDGNDCSGVFGQGFGNCKIPANIDPDQSPIIIKFNFNDGVPGAVEINSGLFPSINGSEFILDFDDPEGKSGTWTYTPAPGTGDPGVTFWVAKGGPNFNLFTDDSGLAVMTGTWFTPLNPGGNQAALSHIDFYDTSGGGPVQVPAPGTLVILGIGLAVLAVAGRKVLARR